MASDAREFMLALDQFERSVPAEAAVFHRRVCLKALVGVVLKSPVGNPSLWKNPAPKGYHGGRFRQNWQLSSEQPVEGVLPGEDPSGNGAIQRGMQVATLIGPFTVAYLQNNLPYAVPLEEGHSTQAPQGVVALTVAELQADFDTTITLPDHMR